MSAIIESISSGMSLSLELRISILITKELSSWNDPLENAASGVPWLSCDLIELLLATNTDDVWTECLDDSALSIQLALSQIPIVKACR